MKRVLEVLISLLLPVAVSARELPPEPPRQPKSEIYAFYFPSLGIFQKSRYPLYDNFYANLSTVNLIQNGPNLSLYAGFSHQIKDMPFFPKGSDEINTLQYLIQSSDQAYGQAIFSFLEIWQIQSELRVIQNHTLENAPGAFDFDYLRLKANMDLAYDSRYSSMEKYYRGMKFLYPQEGFLGRIGIVKFWTWNENGSMRSDTWDVRGSAEFLLNLPKKWVIAFNADGETLLQPTPDQSQLVLSRVPGLQVFGDYAVSACMTVRYLSLRGFFAESPAFWYVNSFLFKFSPGFEMGVGTGLVGFYRHGDPSPLYSVHLGPMLAIRMNGELISVLKINFAIASSSKNAFVFSVSFNTIKDGWLSPVYQKTRKY